MLLQWVSKRAVMHEYCRGCLTELLPTGVDEAGQMSNSFRQ